MLRNVPHVCQHGGVRIGKHGMKSCHNGLFKQCKKPFECCLLMAEEPELMLNEHQPYVEIPIDLKGQFEKELLFSVFNTWRGGSA